MAEDIATLARWQDENDMPFVFVTGPSGLAAEYGALIRSTKIGIGRDGVVAYSAGYGTSSADAWRERLRALAEGG